MKALLIKLIVSFGYCIITFSSLWAQEGAVFLHHYGNPAPRFTTQNNAIIQTLQGTMMVANEQGILHYNGQNWKRINTQSSVYSLLRDEAQIYVGGRADVGYLALRSDGQYTYNSLVDDYKEIRQHSSSFLFVAQTKRFVYFMSDLFLVRVNKEDKRINKVWPSLPKQRYQGLAVANNVLYVNVRGIGLHQLTESSDQLVLTQQGAQFKNLSLSSHFVVASKAYFTANNNQLYRYENDRWQKISLASQSYINVHTLTQGIALSETSFALGTLNGGVLIVQSVTGETLHTINNPTGLPDDEILALGKDNQGGLWIAHPLGLSRAALKIPITDFSYFPGLVGNLTTLLRWQGNLYVATSEGLFSLQKTQQYKDIIQSVEVVNTVQEVPVATKVISKQGGGTAIGNLINKTFGKKARTVVTYQGPKTTRTIETTQWRTPAQLELYRLQSYPYFFQKLKGFNKKVTQLLSLPQELIVGSNDGLYTYDKQEFTSILANIDVQKIHLLDRFLYVGSDSGLVSLVKREGKWQIYERFPAIRTPIYSIIDTKDDRLWLGSENQVIQVNIDPNGRYIRHTTFELAQNYLERVKVVNIKGKPVLFLSNGVYSYNDLQNQFFPDPALYVSQFPYKLIEHPQQLWSNYQSEWKNLVDNATVVYASLFEDITDMYRDEQKQLWAIHENALYRIDTEVPKTDQSFSVLISRVLNYQNERLPLENIEVHQGTESFGLHFILSVPYYLQEQPVAYQYRIKNMTEEWSSWDQDNHLKFPYLPKGKHLIEIRARNSLGQLSEIKQVNVRIIPPFWERWWFYLLEVGVLVGLIIVSTLSNRLERWKRYSHILTLVTIITIFEFIVLYLEPSVDDFSGGVPIFKLFMNILLAISLNPVERRFTAYLSRNKTKGSSSSR